MKIRDMFKDDINRKINGVIKVEQIDDSTERELSEYVITRELKRHFKSFFNTYDEAFYEPTDDIGVWISGFFGSGKSHFLKILSYILENKTINGIRTVERFREKLADDPDTFELIDKATSGPTETILFNIDIEGFSNKDKTAVLRVFAKMFYNHLGFYGEDLKVAKLEQFIDKQGKTEEFRRVFEEKNGAPWLETRNSFSFFEDDIVETLEQVLKMSETAARNWFNGTETSEISIAQLVSEIKEYVSSKPSDFRLLFMIDEAGQYIGTDTSLLLNLQSLVEEVGSTCAGKVWIICTGQEAIDEIIKVRENEFSRIQARFKTRLSLSSSAVDEVIQKRLLTKTDEAKTVLTDEYEREDYALRNLFVFTDSRLDLKGYGNASEFVIDYPFVPYQFILIQKIFSEIRRHGAAGKHYSGAERSMLDGFQIVAKTIEDFDEHALAPLYPFYDSIHTFLDGSIRRVIERCQEAADNHDGIADFDVKVLKLLYLIRYIDDIRSNVDNIVILMVDDLRVDKISLRGKVQNSLDRLQSQNYIDRRGDTYVFLTDEEQDIAREISRTSVDTARIVERIGQIIFDDIYNKKKYRDGAYDFSFDRMVDSTTIGTTTGGMCLRFITIAADPEQAQELYLVTQSKGRAVIVVLADEPYYESLENAMKIRTYIKQRNVSQLPKSAQDIIKDQQDEARKLENKAKYALEQAICDARFYVDGERVEMDSKVPALMIDQALCCLVDHVYRKRALITVCAKDDDDIYAVLQGSAPYLCGTQTNEDAAAEMEEYLEMQDMKHLPTSMEDIQNRYQAIPYGWREIDIAAVAALLIYQQKVTVKVGGETISSNDPYLVEMLRKKSERGKTKISIRHSPSAQKMMAARDIMRQYFGIMDVPDDEEGLIGLIVDKFTEYKSLLEQWKYRSENNNYPGLENIDALLTLVGKLLSQQKDSIALVECLCEMGPRLLKSKEDMRRVEGFFKSQVAIFDQAKNMVADLQSDESYLKEDTKAIEALNQIRLIIDAQDSSVYEKIPELNSLMETVRAGHNRVLEKKRAELLEIVDACLNKIHEASDTAGGAQELISSADSYYKNMKKNIQTTRKLIWLDGIKTQIWKYKDDTLEKIEDLKRPESSREIPDDQTAKPEDLKTVYWRNEFSVGTLRSTQDIDKFVDRIRKRLNVLLKDCDGIELK